MSGLSVKVARVWLCLLWLNAVVVLAQFDAFEDVKPTPKPCIYICKPGLCLYEGCNGPQCPGGACEFRKCKNAACSGETK